MMNYKRFSLSHLLYLSLSALLNAITLNAIDYG